MTTRIAVFVHEGLVQQVVTDVQGETRLAIVDLDIEGACDSDLVTIQSPSGPYQAFVREDEVCNDADVLDNVFAAIHMEDDPA